MLRDADLMQIDAYVSIVQYYGYDAWMSCHLCISDVQDHNCNIHVTVSCNCKL